VIADAGAELNDKNEFVDERVSARNGLLPEQVDATEVTYMDAANKQILGSTAALVPFVEKNRVDRSLMASSMQKQAVPLLQPEAPVVGTGIEHQIALNTSQLVVADGPGEVVRADGDEVHVKYA
jgi:DNA-directed RNA polymerase subunit beta